MLRSPVLVPKCIEDVSFLRSKIQFNYFKFAIVFLYIRYIIYDYLSVIDDALYSIIDSLIDFSSNENITTFLSNLFSQISFKIFHKNNTSIITQVNSSQKYVRNHHERIITLIGCISCDF